MRQHPYPFGEGRQHPLPQRGGEEEGWGNTPTPYPKGEGRRRGVASYFGVGNLEGREATFPLPIIQRQLSPYPLQVAFGLLVRQHPYPSSKLPPLPFGVRGRGVAAFLGRGGFFPSPFIMGFLDREEEGWGVSEGMGRVRATFPFPPSPLG